MEALVRESVRERKVYNWYAHGKRVQDIVLSAAGLVALVPLFLLICLVICLDSPGASPIFVQTRVGKDGRHFRLYKFRTMVPHAEEELGRYLQENEVDGPVFKMRNDPRITRFGRLLRRCSLDELPQLWNVLRGEMSLVGPRPGLPREVAQYSAYDRRRLTVKPGLTCYWQIQPQHNSIRFQEWMALDMCYLREQSFCTDWKILFATIRALLRMDGQ